MWDVDHSTVGSDGPNNLDHYGEGGSTTVLTTAVYMLKCYLIGRETYMS